MCDRPGCYLRFWVRDVSSCRRFCSMPRPGSGTRRFKSRSRAATWLRGVLLQMKEGTFMNQAVHERRRPSMRLMRQLRQKRADACSSVPMQDRGPPSPTGKTVALPSAELAGARATVERFRGGCSSMAVNIKGRRTAADRVRIPCGRWIHRPRVIHGRGRLRLPAIAGQDEKARRRECSCHAPRDVSALLSRSERATSAHSLPDPQ
jgi:hypothetical protein